MRFLTAPVMYALLAASVAGAGVAVWKHVQLAGVRTDFAGYRAETTAKFAEISRLTEEARAKARRAKDLVDAGVSDARTAYHEGVNDGTSTANDLVAGYRAGERRLRGDLQACRAGPAPAGGSADAAARSDGAGEAGLSGADVEFLVWFANDADVAVRRLTLCQSYVTHLLDHWPQP